MSESSRRLRIQHLIVHTVLSWDDGAELTPGPEVKPVMLSLGQIADFASKLPAEVAALQAQTEAAPELVNG